MTEEQERERDRVKKYRYTLFVLLLCISKCIGRTGIQRCKKTSIKKFCKNVPDVSVLFVGCFCSFCWYCTKPGWVFSSLQVIYQQLVNLTADILLVREKGPESLDCVGSNPE